MASNSKGMASAGAVTVCKRRRDLFEIAVAYGLILLVAWTPPPWKFWFWGGTAITIASIIFFSFDGVDAAGLRRKGFKQSLWVAGMAGFAALGAILLASHLSTLHLPQNIRWFWINCCGYAIWSFVQQFLLQAYFLSRLARLIEERFAAALFASILFASVHLPSPLLAPVTLLWGLAACLLFFRYRNLYTLAMAHAILGITLAITVPSGVSHHMRVGLGYLTYTAHQHPRSLQP